MKYVVITSKHHDGFALFKSSVSPYNVVDATPYKKDLLKQLADACARRGMRLGFYYSQSQDWHEKDGAGNTWDFLDATYMTGVKVTKTYQTGGVKKFKLTVRNTSNLTTTITGSFTLL